jgi:hypothetical protein
MDMLTQLPIEIKDTVLISFMFALSVVIFLVSYFFGTPAIHPQVDENLFS